MNDYDAMPARLNLIEPGWVRSGSTQARGQAFDASGALLRADALAARFDALAGDEQWLRLATELNGNFAAVTSGDGVLRAVTDRLRGIPLFFARVADGWLVADTAQVIRNELRGSAIDPACAEEFALTGYVTGSQTLIGGLSQIPAGHCLFQRLSSTEPPQLERYFSYRHGDLFDDDDDALITRLIRTHQNVFQRLVEDIGERQIVVPLSGGYDSRLIGVALRDLGCRNVLCYSYGVDGNWESNISRELAQYLGFRWTMVPYSATRWREWAATDEFQRFFRASGNLSSSPHFQDWPAVRELIRRREIASDAIFVPGHSGDFLAGSHIPKWFARRTHLTRDETLRSITDAHYSLWDWPPDERAALRGDFDKRIEAIVGPVADGSAEQAADVFECWDCAERQAKFIVNSVRVYEALGHEWRLPLFDNELMDFWSRVPIGSRIGRRLYFEFARRHQQLPITAPNTDRGRFLTGAIKLADQMGLRPAAKRAQRVLRRLRWRREYASDNMGWFALIAAEDFRFRYTGFEIGHAFFARQYLDSVLA